MVRQLLAVARTVGCLLRTVLVLGLAWTSAQKFKILSVLELPCHRCPCSRNFLPQHCREARRVNHLGIWMHCDEQTTEEGTLKLVLKKKDANEHISSTPPKGKLLSEMKNGHQPRIGRTQIYLVF
jgi:hypothetical protein